MSQLTEKTIAFLATDGVEQVELTRAWQAVEQAGGTPILVSPQPGEIQSYDNDVEPAQTFAVQRTVADADAADFAALVLPGGTTNPDKLRQEDAAVAFVRAFFEQGKPVAAICHAPWLLVEADVIRGRTLTSFPSVQTDLRNAGAEWVDEEVVVDDGPPTLVTSRNPGDLEAFAAKLVEGFAEGEHRGQKASV